MPTILQVGRYQFKFFSNEGTEPPHIHVKAGSDQAKFWLDLIELASNYGFKAHELNYTSAVFVLVKALSDCSLNGLSRTVESGKGNFFNSAYSAELKKFTSRSWNAV